MGSCAILGSMSSAIEGAITAMVTTFAENGSVDEPAARRLARHLVENGSHGLVVAGTTGEGATLTDEEQISLLRAVIEEVGGETMVACGTGTNDTRHSSELSAAAEQAGADALLVVTPYYNRPNRAGLLEHFGHVAGAVSCPVILYNIPSRCAINMPPDLLAELARIDNVVAVKQANQEELGPIEGLNVLAGDDSTFLRCLEMGGAGGILTSANVISADMRAVYDAATTGELEAARRLDAKLQPFYEAMFVTANPIPVKTAAEMLGLIPSAMMRLPMVPADEAQRSVVRAALEAQGLLSTTAG